MAKEKKEIKLTLTKDKDCKHSVRYSTEIQETGQTFSVYMPRVWIGNPVPEKVSITIE